MEEKKQIQQIQQIPIRKTHDLCICIVFYIGLSFFGFLLCLIGISIYCYFNNDKNEEIITCWKQQNYILFLIFSPTVGLFFYLLIDVLCCKLFRRNSISTTR